MQSLFVGIMYNVQENHRRFHLKRVVWKREPWGTGPSISTYSIIVGLETVWGNGYTTTLLGGVGFAHILSPGFPCFGKPTIWAYRITPGSSHFRHVRNACMKFQNSCDNYSWRGSDMPIAALAGEQFRNRIHCKHGQSRIKFNHSCFLLVDDISKFIAIGYRPVFIELSSSLLPHRVCLRCCTRDRTWRNTLGLC